MNFIQPRSLDDWHSVHEPNEGYSDSRVATLDPASTPPTRQYWPRLVYGRTSSQVLLRPSGRKYYRVCYLEASKGHHSLGQYVDE